MKSYLVNDPKLKFKRSYLRKNQTEVERLLWAQLRRKQLKGVKFFRQYSIGDYIVDFYSPKNRLAVKIDGGQHNEEKLLKHDEQRTLYFKQFGVKVIRFWNNDVLKNLEGVLDIITENIR